MYNPKDILTESGYRKYMMHIENMRESLFYIINHADDLHLGARNNDKSLDIIYAMNELIESKFLETGDGETDEE